MKKIILFCAVALAAMTACNNAQKEAEAAAKAKADSIARADSIAKVVEQHRLDSIRQDSIRQIEEAMAKIPTFNEINNARNRASLFRNRGFKVSTRKVYEEIFSDYSTYITASLNLPNGVSCKYSEGFPESTFTLVGAPELLDKYLAEAKAWCAVEKRKYSNIGGANFYAKKTGNKVTVYAFWGD